MSTMQVEVVSSEKQLYAGEAEMVVVPGISGELGIMPKHAPLLTQIKPGVLKINQSDGTEELLYVAGGVLEVQPDKVTVLADIAERSEDLDAERAEEARRAAEQKLHDSAAGEMDYAQAQAELARAVAQLQVINQLRKRAR